MAAFEFLFGKRREDRQAPLGEKIKHQAKGKLEGKIIRNSFNAWWLVLLRNYILYPMVKLPLLPISEALSVRRKIRIFSIAEEILINSGEIKPSQKLWFFHPKGPKEWRRQLSEGLSEGRYGDFLRQLLMPMRSILWKPFGHQLRVERYVCQKLFGIATAMWAISAAIYAYSVSLLLNEGIKSTVTDISRLYKTLNIFYTYSLSTGSAFKTYVVAGGFWLISLVFAILLATRKWVSMSEKVRAFLRDTLMIPDEIDRAEILAMDDLICIGGQGISMPRLKGILSGWPDNFQPGAYYASTVSTTDVVILRRPELPPILFGGIHTESDIASRYDIYDKKIIGKMRDAVKQPGSSELLVLGEVIDPRWWRSSQIFVPLATNPHVNVAGQTRSGKSKGVLSFVYSFHKAYPETVWYFADGKGSPDYDSFAEYMSPMPVAKPDQMGDPLLQLANVVKAVFDEYQNRVKLFAVAGRAGKPCSTIYQYRELVGPLHHVWLVIDEFSVFNMELDFEANYKVDKTLPSMLKRISAEAASYGIHLLVASQRYQQTDMPSVFRSNLTTRLIFNVQATDAHFLGFPEATTLKPGQCLISASGLYCEHTGLNVIKARLPYVGNMPDRLLAKTLEPMAAALKKPFDRLVQYRTGADYENITVTQLCLKLQKFFLDQNYISRDLEADVEAVPVQMEIERAERVSIQTETGEIREELVSVGESKIGISVLRPEEVDEDSLSDMQDRYRNYPMIIVFIHGKGQTPGKTKFVKELNERGTRFYIYNPRVYSRDISFVIMRRQQGEEVDLIKGKAASLGVSNVHHEEAATTTTFEEMHAKNTPIRMKVGKLLSANSIIINNTKDSVMQRGMATIEGSLPGGVPLTIVIATDKGKRQDARDVAQLVFEAGGATLIVTDEKFTDADLRQFKSMRTALWKNSYVNELIVAAKDGKIPKDFLGKFFKDIGITDESNRQMFGKNASLIINCDIDPAAEKVKRLVIECNQTKVILMTFPEFPIHLYNMELLKIPESAKVCVANGMAPMGANPNLVQLKLSKYGQLASFPPTSKWEVRRGVLSRRESNIDVNDPLLLAMKQS